MREPIINRVVRRLREMVDFEEEETMDRGEGYGSEIKKLESHEIHQLVQSEKIDFVFGLAEKKIEAIRHTTAVLKNRATLLLGYVAGSIALMLNFFLENSVPFTTLTFLSGSLIGCYTVLAFVIARKLLFLTTGKPFHPDIKVMLTKEQMAPGVEIMKFMTLEVMQDVYEDRSASQKKQKRVLESCTHTAFALPAIVLILTLSASAVRNFIS